MSYAEEQASGNWVYEVFRKWQPEWVHVKFVATGAAGMELQFFRFFEAL